MLKSLVSVYLVRIVGVQQHSSTAIIVKTYFVNLTKKLNYIKPLLNQGGYEFASTNNHVNRQCLNPL